MMSQPANAKSRHWDQQAWIRIVRFTPEGSRTKTSVNSISRSGDLASRQKPKTGSARNNCTSPPTSHFPPSLITLPSHRIAASPPISSSHFLLEFGFDGKRGRTAMITTMTMMGFTFVSAFPTIVHLLIFSIIFRNYFYVLELKPD